jgi:formylglycine-generating enzyme required for sulfatase activity/outer membrane protein assembly factor BamB
MEIVMNQTLDGVKTRIAAMLFWSTIVLAGQNSALSQDQLHREKIIVLPDDVKLELVLIPAGEFMMGEPGETTGSRMQHRVKITRPFYMGKYEITQAQWKAVTGYNPSNRCGSEGLDRPLQRPVQNISWYEVRKKFLPKMQQYAPKGWEIRLPTEAEWEYACRAGTKTKFHCGDTLRKEQANFWYRLYKGLMPVGSFPANNWGLHDMHGNVWEWCEDRYDEDFYRNSPVEDPFNNRTGVHRVLRGGAFCFDADHCASAFRYAYPPLYWIHCHSWYLGFRVVLGFPLPKEVEGEDDSRAPIAPAVPPGGESKSDWPQFMRVPEHTGSAAEEDLTLPLGLVAQVKLDDMVTTSPAIVGNRVYVCDQMGTAYCIDPDQRKIIWKSSPDARKAMGGNSSSPCYAKGRVCYGTTAGTFHILDASDGKVVKTADLGWPIIVAPVYANDSVYVHTVGAVVHCMDLDGNERWRWDHYQRYRSTVSQDVPGAGEKESYYSQGPNYSGHPLCVSGNKIVAGAAWDTYCLEDRGKDAGLSWCLRPYLYPMEKAISGGYIYYAGLGWDGAAFAGRFLLKDAGAGEMIRHDPTTCTPAVRGSRIYCGQLGGGFSAYEFADDVEPRKLWTDAGKSLSIASSALSRDHVVIATTDGELIVSSLDGPNQSGPFRFKTPHGKLIASSPAISGGRVFFGCDDGYLYVLGPAGRLKPEAQPLVLHEPKSRGIPAKGEAYAWSCRRGNAANTCSVEDPGFRPPLKVRWAMRNTYCKNSPVTDLDSIYVLSCRSLMTAIEQSTGRIRWRQMVSDIAPGSSLGLFCPTIYQRQMYLLMKDGKGFFCLDTLTGELLWKKPRVFERGENLVCGEGLVVWSTVSRSSDNNWEWKTRAFDAASGAEVWTASPEGAWKGNRFAMTSGCVLDGRLFYSRKDGQEGLTIALDLKTGKIIWTNKTYFLDSVGPVCGRDGRIYVGGSCLSAADGTLIWKGNSVTSLGKDYGIRTTWGGQGFAFSLKDGKGHTELSTLGTWHSCNDLVPVVAPGLSLHLSPKGLLVQDLSNGKAIWASRGFAPATCTYPAVANGRVFVTSHNTGAIYCFEPEEK